MVEAVSALYKHVTWAGPNAPLNPPFTWCQSHFFFTESMSSSPSSAVFNTMSHAVTEKLTSNNFCLWKAQVWPAVRGAQLTAFLDGTKKIPEEYILIEKEAAGESPKP
jgi:hypothetical protein